VMSDRLCIQTDGAVAEEHAEAAEALQSTNLVVAGGGRNNPVLMRELRQRCHGVQLLSSDHLGLAAEAREALVFALLA